MRTNLFSSILLTGLVLACAELQAAGPDIQQVNRALDIAERAAAAGQLLGVPPLQVYLAEVEPCF